MRHEESSKSQAIHSEGKLETTAFKKDFNVYQFHYDILCMHLVYFDHILFIIFFYPLPIHVESLPPNYTPLHTFFFFF